MKRVLLVASTTGYQVREFGSAAEALGVELVLATDRCHILTDPWGDDAAALRFDDPEDGIQALAARGPFDGITAVGDQPAYVASQIAERFHLAFHPPDATQAAANKLRTRECFRTAGMRVPEFHLVPHDAPLPEAIHYPCVIKPLDGSGSRGVIRANNKDELQAARDRIRRMQHGAPVLIETFIPGREFALDGLVSHGRLRALALFDKPDPLDGPFFEETIYVTPSREPSNIQDAIHKAAQQAVTALGLTHGPVHAEMRVNPEGVWILEVAARPIGGLCSRVLQFGTSSLEEILLRHSVGEDISRFTLSPGAHAVMMIPIPAAGTYRAVEGLDAALRIPGLAGIVITAKEGQQLIPLPEGSSYLGFTFARASTPEEAEQALRLAHKELHFSVSPSLPIVR